MELVPKPLNKGMAITHSSARRPFHYQVHMFNVNSYKLFRIFHQISVYKWQKSQYFGIIEFKLVEKLSFCYNEGNKPPLFKRSGPINKTGDKLYFSRLVAAVC